MASRNKLLRDEVEEAKRAAQKAIEEAASRVAEAEGRVVGVRREQETGADEAGARAAEAERKLVLTQDQVRRRRGRGVEGRG